MCNCATRSRNLKQMGHKRVGSSVACVVSPDTGFTLVHAVGTCSVYQNPPHRTLPCSFSPDMCSAMLLLPLLVGKRLRVWPRSANAVEKNVEKNIWRSARQCGSSSAWRGHATRHEVWVQPPRVGLVPAFKLLKVLS